MVANVRNPILGADFLEHYGLVVDVGNKPLADTRTNLSVQGIISLSLLLSPLLLPQQPDNDFAAVMLKFPTITQLCSKDRPIKHDITCCIEMAGAPVSARPQILAPEQLKSARQEFERMLELGIILPSSTNWSSPLHMVTKKSRKLVSLR